MQSIGSDSSLEDYLQTGYRNLKAEMERVHSTIDDVWPLFEASYSDTYGWPYEIHEDDPSSRQNRYSFSTNAMILFSLALGLGWLRTGSLARSSKSPEIPDPGQIKSKFVAGFNKLLAEAKAANYVFLSSSFGKNDPLTLSWLVEILANKASYLDEKDLNKESFEEFENCVKRTTIETLKRVFTNPKCSLQFDGAQDKRSLDHVFPLLRAVQLFKSLELDFPDKSKAPPEYQELAVLCKKEVSTFLLNRLHFHLAIVNVSNSNFDASELVFALEGLLLVDDHVDSIDPNLLKECFSVVAKTQSRSSYWRPLKPFVTTPSGLALLPLSVEIANSLLRICKLIEMQGQHHQLITDNCDLFANYYSWLYTRKTEIQFKLKDNTLQRIVGWHSEHIYSPHRIHPWETAQVTIFLLQYLELLQQTLAANLLTRANLSIRTPRRKSDFKLSPAEYWDATWAHKEPLNSLHEASKYRVYHEISKKFLKPRSGTNQPKDSGGFYSMLLYGPPGTGKSSVADELAKALGWSMVTITPSDFISHGEAGLEARAKMIFKTLDEQKDIVILFDEIDNLMLHRECLLYADQSTIFQMMTPSMLVKLKNLREQKSTIFIVATNYAERIDPAAKRTGRIDSQFLICPPDASQRFSILKNLTLERFKRELHPSAQGLSSLKETFTAEAFAAVLSKMTLATYGEFENLVKSAVSQHANDKQWPSTEQLIRTYLRQIENSAGPSINLKSYSNRLKESVKPEEEYLALCYLAIEGQQFTAKDEELLLEQIPEDIKNIRIPADKQRQMSEDLKGKIGDAIIVDTIVKCLLHQ